MTPDRRLLLSLILLMACGLFVVEARYRPREDLEPKHRHRHRHESSNGRRNRHDLIDSWSQELDYEDDSLEDDEDDYDAGPYYERFYPRTSRVIGAHGRVLEPHFPTKYRRGGGYRWYNEDDERRRASPRHPARGYRPRSHRRLGYSRSRDDDYEEYEDEFDYEKVSRGYENNGHRVTGKNGRKYRIPSRHDRRPDARKRHRVDDLDGSWKYDDNRRRSNSSEYSFRTGRRKTDEDYDYREDADDEEEEIWKEEDEDQNEDDDDEEFDNDFYNGEKRSSMKTYDDIIRRLTSNDPTTVRTTVRRDYRNIEPEKHARRDAYESFKYEPRNLSRSLDHDVKFASSPNAGHDRQSMKKIVENPSSKLLGTLVDRKSTRNVSNGADRLEKRIVSKMDDGQARTKSLEQDYDEYVNSPDNEKEEDLIKAGAEEDSAMQADVTNTDYAEDEDEDETPATTTSSTTTSTTTTSTTTTTTTPKPVVAQNYDYRESKGYEGGTGAQYNGYQSKNDYPPMSAHSAHKWQTLGTRESVKETRSNIQQYNKNGKTAEIREALQHAIKVSREGSCQWPRPRVIPVRDVYPSPSTTYIPHCAILHRCSDDTGCCRSEALTCVPKHSHRVELSFYTTNVGGSSVVEKLSFYNHTECECREKTEYDTPYERPSEQRVYRHYTPSPQPQNMRRVHPRKPCRCPSEFTPRITSDGECQCNCYETHQNCIKIRRGKGFFSLADRLCIQHDDCALPSCEFGEYMRQQGKCPRKKDKFDKIANYHRTPSHWYRS